MYINGLGVNTHYHQTQSGVAHRAVTQFGGEESSLSSAGKSSKPGIVSRAFSFITSIPSMIFNAVWTTVKYTVYILSLRVCCKPEHSPKAMKEALQTVIDAEDRAAAWATFTKNFPRGVDQLNSLALEQMRIADISAKDNMDPRKVAEWNKENRADCLAELNEGWEEQDLDLLNQAAGYLQQVIDSQSK